MGVHTMEPVGHDVYVIAEAGACGDGKLSLMIVCQYQVFMYLVAKIIIQLLMLTWMYLNIIQK